MIKNKIGVMKGRLLPKYQGRYQAHPVNYCQNEFEIAKKIGLDCIEFILDYNDA
jgi:L-ribulose-5-phosphate 3-epimerase